jgi:uncharacterized protein YbjT (DUF2867 family)
MAQENLIEASPVPYTIVRATQFFEFAGGIAHTSTEGETVRLPPALVQPMAAEDVAEALSEIALEAPQNGMVEIAGPAPLGLDKFVGQFLSATGDARKVVTDPAALYFGLALDDRSLTPGKSPRLGKTTFADWLGRSKEAR